jgi:hypothetical protein
LTLHPMLGFCSASGGLPEKPVTFKKPVTF